MALADRLFYHPTRTEYDAPENCRLAYESVRIPSTDGVWLHGWWFPSHGTPRGTVVHCHGNAGNITAHFRFVAWLPSCGFNVLCFDYRGYGQSTGKVTRAGTLADAHAAVDHARGRPGVDPARMLLLGQSIGGTIGIRVAAERDDLCGVAFDGPFSSYRKEAYFVARHSILWGVAGLVSRYLISDDLSAIEVVHRIAPCPALFIAGTDDHIVDFRQAVELYEAAGDPKELRVVEGADHCESLVTEDDDGRDHLAQFFTRCANSGVLNRDDARGRQGRRL